MIAKKYRLSERELKKVFRKKNPFFSEIMVANVAKNRLPYTRFAIMLSSKNTPGSVNRNAFRRLFYDFSSDWVSDSGYDIVIVLKKGTKLSHKNSLDRDKFSKNLLDLYNKIPLLIGTL